MIRYGSVCSGIEAATVAWHSLGWVPSFFSEIEKFPREVLAHHYPDVPLHGDFTTIGANQYGSIDLLVGGTPCQSFSIAGLRKGLDDDRGNLALEFIKLAQRTRPRWVVWENVPGVLSSNGGRDFGSFLGALGEIGYGFAYRVLDAQYFGVAQRRRRVFVVGYLGDWRRAAAVLFERESLSGNPAPSREKGQVTPTLTKECTGVSRPGHNEDGWYIPTVTARMVLFGEYSTDGSASALKARDYKDATDLVAYPLNTMTMQGRPSDNGRMGLGIGSEIDPSPTLTKAHSHAVAYGLPGNWIGRKPENGGNQTEPFYEQSPCQTRTDRHAVANNMAVRRLTPIECERLQGFPDGYTDIKEKCPDGPRYKALGNSMAVPVMHWIGKRIQMVEELCQ